MGIAVKVTQNAGSKVYLNDVLSSAKRVDLADRKLPYSFVKGCMVVFRGEIHILGSNNSPMNLHYKWNGVSWEQVSTTPVSFYHANAVVYDDSIHVVVNQGHYAWDGTEWTKLGVITGATTDDSCMVVYNDEIHVIGSGTEAYAQKHFKYDGTSWTQLSNTPVKFMYSCAVTYNNEIHVIGGSGGYYHYAYNGTSWRNVGNISLTRTNASAVVYDNKLYVFGSTTNYARCDAYDGSSWTRQDDSVVGCVSGRAVVYDNAIYYIGGLCGSYMMAKYNETLYSAEITS